MEWAGQYSSPKQSIITRLSHAPIPDKPRILNLLSDLIRTGLRMECGWAKWKHYGKGAEKGQRLDTRINIKGIIFRSMANSNLRKYPLILSHFELNFCCWDIWPTLMSLSFILHIKWMFNTNLLIDVKCKIEKTAPSVIPIPLIMIALETHFLLAS